MSYLRVEFHVFHPSPSPESGKGFLAAGFLLRRNRAIRLLPVRDFCSGAYISPTTTWPDVDSVGETPRRLLFVRITRWIMVLSVLALLVSGIGILVSHPRLYWGETGN